MLVEGIPSSGKRRGEMQYTNLPRYSDYSRGQREGMMMMMWAAGENTAKCTGEQAACKPQSLSFASLGRRTLALLMCR
jgi:hypothetical protein